SRVCEACAIFREARRAKTLVTVATWGLVQRSIAEKGAWLAKLPMCDTLLEASIVLVLPALHLVFRLLEEVIKILVAAVFLT
ncbi:MAG: hypothetical protein ACI9HE_002737, partial [Planctomycetota bacterium]